MSLTLHQNGYVQQDYNYSASPYMPRPNVYVELLHVKLKLFISRDRRQNVFLSFMLCLKYIYGIKDMTDK